MDEEFSFSICTVDGQRFSFGDCDVDFTIQSCSKVFTYLMALADSSPEEVHSHVGVEPSGRAFNEFVLDKKGKPHNPMINAGAITICSLVKRTLKGSRRFAEVLGTFSDFAGGARVRVCLFFLSSSLPPVLSFSPSCLPPSPQGSVHALTVCSARRGGWAAPRGSPLATAALAGAQRGR